MLPEVGLQATIAGLGQFESGASVINKAFTNIDNRANVVSKSVSHMGGELLNLGQKVTKLAAVGVLSVGAAIGGVIGVGLDFNNTLEQTSAKINAFTKDGKKTAEILEMIRVEAAKTPFTFEAMATAAASLQPVVKASGESLENLIKDAEILAASNPLEGLEGASFSLREAVSGDFTSIIERFNLSRTTINKLKKEGVPALEIVRIAMREMGFDADLVANMAKTAEGRWSTFYDTLVNLAGIATKPIFELWSTSLGNINNILAVNEPLLTEWATTLGGIVSESISKVVKWITLISELGMGAGLTIFTDIFGPEGIGIWKQISDAIGFVVAHLEEFKGALIGVGAVIAGAAIAASIVAIGGAIAGLATGIGPVILAAGLLGAAWAGNWGGIQEKTMAVWAAVQPVLKEAWTWLSTNLPPAIQTLATFWNDTLLPAITATTDFFTNTVFPIFGDFVKLYVDTTTDRLKVLTDTWDLLIVPLTAVGDYISTTISPFFLALGNVIGSVVNLGLRAMAGLWQNVLYPALLKVGNYLSETFGPAFKAIGDWLSTTFGPIIKTLGDTFLPKVSSGFSGITTAIQSATDWINDLATNINSLQLPAWLEPGSPTPFQIALEGLAAVLSGLLLSAFQSTFAVITSVTSGVQTQFNAYVLSITNFYTVTLPLLQSTAISVAASIISAYNPVQSLINTITSAVNALAQAFGPVGAAAIKAGNDIKKGMEKAADSIVELKQVVREATKEFDKMAEAARRAADASNSAGDSASRAGNSAGFQHGTSGFTVPPGFPNDRFKVGLTSGERVIVVPQGQTTTNMSNQSNTVYNFNMSVNSVASPQSVIQQFHIMRAMAT